MKFDPLYYPYPSRRNVVYGNKGMVATSQSLAAQAGLEILKSGGNAIDAAIATAACLTVVEPTSNGIGGDLFALVWTKGKLHGLNASGPAPSRISINRLKELGIKEIPKYGWIPVTLHNRGHNFVLNEEHCNCLAPGKRPYHTIIPGFLSKGDNPIGPFGVMGGFMQPQGHMQVIMNTIDFGLNPQQALDAPRWQWIEGKRVEVEPNFPNHIVEQLIRKGHKVSVQLEAGNFGRGQIIWKTDEGTLCGGTEPRTDGAVVSW